MSDFKAKARNGFLNYFPIGQIPLLKKIQTTKFREEFSPEEREARYQEYRDSAGLGSGLTSTDVFKKYDDTHTDSLDKLSKIKMGDEKSSPITIDGKSISEKLNKTLKKPDSDAAKAVPEVKAAFATALALSDEIKQARINFDEDVKALNAIIKQDPPAFNLSAISSHVAHIRKTATTAIEKQQATEIQKITALFDEPMAAKIKLTMDLSDEQFTSLKTDTLSTLGKKHTSEKSDLDKALGGEETKLHQYAQKERDRIALLSSLYKNSQFMKEMIDKLHAEEVAKRRAAGQPEEEIIMAMGPDMIKSIANDALRNIGIGDLTQIETETGLKIDVNKNAQGEISFYVELPSVYNKERYLATMTCLAMSCRACGHEHCTMNITEKDEEKALKAARLAFEGAVLAGYNPDKNISIVINGKEKKIQELFPDTRENKQNNKLGFIRNLYAKNHAQEESFKEKPSSLEEQDKIKKAVQAERDKQNIPPDDPGLNGAIPGAKP